MNRLSIDWRKGYELPEMIGLTLKNGMVETFSILPTNLNDFTLDDINGIVTDLKSRGMVNLEVTKINVSIEPIDSYEDELLVYITTFHYDTDGDTNLDEFDVVLPLHEFIDSGEVYY